jgi:hypothetical protein
MLDGDGVVDGSAKEHMKKMVVEWIIGTYNAMSGETVQNAWKKKGFEWILN